MQESSLRRCAVVLMQLILMEDVAAILVFASSSFREGFFFMFK